MPRSLRRPLARFAAGAALVLVLGQAGLLLVWGSMPEPERQRRLLHALPDPELAA